MILFYSMLLAIAYNGAFWRYLGGITTLSGGHGLLLAGAVLLLLCAFFSFSLSILPWRYGGRVLLSILLPLSAMAAYFMSQYGTAIDGRMIQNVFETDINEIRDLLTVRMAFYLAFLGVFPVLMLWLVPLQSPPSLLRRLGRRLIFMSLAFSVFLLMLGVQYQAIASIARNHKEIRYFIVPNNFMKGLADYAKELNGVSGADAANEVKAVAPDAKRGSSWAGRSRKALFVLVVGETARAENFGLDGYARSTTPKLMQQEGLINFTQMSSCGTDTAVSLPCMMSGLGRADYSLAKARGHENVLDVVKRAGLRVLWIDNQSGCKQVCDRVERMNTSSMNDPRFCSDGECHDGILVEKLRELAEQSTQDTLVVLHQMGSHGPSYYKRYPDEFAEFQPACATAQLDKCSREEIRNAYDNTILYTDHVLSELITTLRANSDRYDTGLFYLSDHGESLGELGLYLHGAPYMLAPDVQTHVPAVMWISPGLEKSRGLSAQCLAAKSRSPLSQDNLFDSMLGLLDIQTRSYRPPLDIFHSCLSTT
ncbi:MAG: phosphoethanolamine transferase [Moraxellaceae bacterium]